MRTRIANVRPDAFPFPKSDFSHGIPLLAQAQRLEKERLAEQAREEARRKEEEESKQEARAKQEALDRELVQAGKREKAARRKQRDENARVRKLERQKDELESKESQTMSVEARAAYFFTQASVLHAKFEERRKKDFQTSLDREEVRQLAVARLSCPLPSPAPSPLALQTTARSGGCSAHRPTHV